MANQLDRTKQQLSVARAEARAAPGVVRVAIPTLGGTFGAGFLDAKFPNFMNGRMQPSTAAGLVTATAGYFMENEMAIYAGVGMLTPQAYTAGVKAAGYDVAIIEATPDDAGDTA